MHKQALIVLSLVAMAAGCAVKPENPTDYVTFRDEPLVQQVEDGMTKQQVRTIGGPPSSAVKRGSQAGTCNNYVLNRDGHQQVYYVSFDGNGLVDSKGFMTCEQHRINEEKL